MDIYIDRKAKEYIKNKSRDNAIQIVVERIGGGWCVSYQPSVKVGKPYNNGSFLMHKVGDIDVYISPNAKVRNGELKIGLNKILWIRSLNVDGLVLWFNKANTPIILGVFQDFKSSSIAIEDRIGSIKFKLHLPSLV